MRYIWQGSFTHRFKIKQPINDVMSWPHKTCPGDELSRAAPTLQFRPAQTGSYSQILSAYPDMKPPRSRLPCVTAPTRSHKISIYPGSYDTQEFPEGSPPEAPIPLFLIIWYARKERVVCCLYLSSCYGFCSDIPVQGAFGGTSP